jgi:integrase/recombinase XerD
MVCEVASILWPVMPHVLRYTFSVTAIQTDISLPTLQRLLGHDRLTTTEIYLNLSPEEVARTVAAYQAIRTHPPNTQEFSRF